MGKRLQLSLKLWKKAMICLKKNLSRHDHIVKIKIPYKRIFDLQKLKSNFLTMNTVKEAHDTAKEPIINATETKNETVNEKTENEEKKSNGNHTPV